MAVTSPIITEAMRALVERKDLSRIEAAGAMEAIMSGAATDAQIAAFLTALRMKGETVEELIGFAQVMRQKVVKVRTGGSELVGATGTDREMLIDTAGTGGDASGTFNVSTATAFVVAGAGLKVAKHGNRSMSSLCGSADVVETLGIKIELSSAKIACCVDEIGIGFLYAPLLHTAMKHVMTARREMGVRTVFNLLGPLTTPAGANAQIIGVRRSRSRSRWPGCSPSSGPCASSSRRADGLDESRIRGRAASGGARGRCNSTVRPRTGLPCLHSGSAWGERARTPRSSADPRRRGGPRRDSVLMNVAAALLVGGLAHDLKDGVALAARSIDSGAAATKLEGLVALSQRLATE